MRKTQSPILTAVHDTAKGLHKAGVMDQVTLPDFDPLYLSPVEQVQPETIKTAPQNHRKIRKTGLPT